MHFLNKLLAILHMYVSSPRAGWIERGRVHSVCVRKNMVKLHGTDRFIIGVHVDSGIAVCTYFSTYYCHFVHFVQRRGYSRGRIFIEFSPTPAFAVQMVVLIYESTECWNDEERPVPNFIYSNQSEC